MQTRPGSEVTMNGGGMRTRAVSMAILAIFFVIALKGLSVAMTGSGDVLARTASFVAPERRADIVDRNGGLENLTPLF